ncbi:hypothetical protein A0Y61_08430, partial [Campylobacter upsaliensis]|nr:hypothetical protein [Campylobacter upsaliensis]
HLLDDIEKILELDLAKQDNENLKLFEKNLSKLQEKIFFLKADEPQEQTLFEITEDNELNNAGDFRSKDCIELLKLADIVVTNPPFSLFREYVAQLVEYDKKFLIVAHQNCITYKEVFSLIKDKKLWLGYGFKGGAGHFINYHYKDYAKASDHKEGMIRVSGVTWVTNLTHKKRNEILETISSYKKNPEQYPKYDNYDAINVDKTIEIPLDYDGIMGVPITFLDKHNPKQFEIVALGIVGSVDFTCNKKMEVLDKFGNSTGKFTFNAKGTLYRKFNPHTDKTPAFKDCESGELYSSIYARILIRKIAEVAELRKLEFEKM